MPVKSFHPLGDITFLAKPKTEIPTERVFIQDAQLKLVKALHLMASVCWIGGAFALLVLAGLREVSRLDSELVRGINLCIFYVDSLLVLPGVLGCIVTGLLYSVYTPFGFIKYFWIAYKWIVCLNAFFWGSLFLGPWSDDLFICAVEYGFYDILDLVYNCVMPQTSWGAYLQILLLSSVVVISVYRPVSLFNWYDYQKMQPRGVRHGH